MNVSQYFESRERRLLGARYEELYSGTESPARGITVNTLRIQPQDLAAACGIPLQLSPFCEAGFLIDPQEKPGRHPYHHAGAFYVQEPSASAAAPLAGVRPGMKVADLCAAPGGKSSQLAAALAGEGLLLSNEYNAQRAEILKSNLERMGVANAVISNADTANIAKAFPAFFDRVLVDAPCSGEGMFRKEPQAVAQHCEGLVQQCAALGAQILDNAAAMLAPGGVLVFSTCTFAPEEDEGQVAAFLLRHPEFSLLDCGVAFGAQGEANRCGGFPLEVEKVRRIWPCNGGEGHFLACMQKHAAEISAPRPPKKARAPKPCPEWEDFCEKNFGTLPAGRAVRVGDSIYLPPLCALPDTVAKLRVLRTGVFAGTVQKGRFVPAHHLAMAFGAQCKNTERLSLSDPRCAAWLRGEEIEAYTAGAGWCTVLVDGMPLGWGKQSGGRVKNHYPKALRNLK